jgi:hypothetical protein
MPMNADTAPAPLTPAVPIPTPLPASTTSAAHDRTKAIRRRLATWSTAAWLHLRRSFAWDLRNLPLSEAEQKRLEARGTDHPILRRYLAWRRSVLLIVCLPVTLLAVLNTLDLLSDDFPKVNVWGRLWLGLQILAPFAMPAAVVLAAATWANPRWSQRLIAVGWAVAFLVPLLLLLVPVHWLFNFQRHAEQVGVRYAFGLIFFVILCVYLPVFVVSMSLGVQRACLRVKTLVPQSVVPGLFLTASAPVLPLVLLPFFILVNQVASSWLLILGMLLLMASPGVYAIAFPLFARPLLQPGDFRKVWVAQLTAKSLFWIGILLLLIYAMTRVWVLPNLGDEVDELRSDFDHKTLLGFSAQSSLLRPWNWDVIRWLVIETLGRSLFTTVLVADLFMRVNRIVWQHHRQLPAGPHTEEYDQLMDLLDRPKQGK